MNLDKEKLSVKINETLERLRPFLHADGGDMELVEISDDGIAKVKLLGACSDCSMSMMTLKAGLEEAVIKECPEIKAVEAINLPEVLS
ncbi:MAG: NifU family protein [Bacteroidetes bacterium]|nr:MAG: NifU family protein [Bacteroidota bacterium]